MLLLPRSRSTARSGMSVWSQSPIHRECFCYIQRVQFIDRACAPVAIPYSSGMLLLLASDLHAGGVCQGFVAIPYSSGMLLLLHFLSDWSLVRQEASQSPIHRECFCYQDHGRRPDQGCRCGRNPLFIGNAFATSALTVGIHVIRGDVGRNPLFIGNAFATVPALP